MGMYATANLIYGLIASQEKPDTVMQVINLLNSKKYDPVFMQKIEQIKKETGVVADQFTSLEGIEVLYAFSVEVFDRAFTSATISVESLLKTTEYEENINKYLDALGIALDTKPQWHLLAYMS